MYHLFPFRETVYLRHLDEVGIHSIRCIEDRRVEHREDHDEGDDEGGDLTIHPDQDEEDDRDRRQYAKNDGKGCEHLPKKNG